MTSAACIALIIASASSVPMATADDGDAARAAFVAARFTRVDRLRDLPAGVRRVMEQLVAMPEAERQELEQLTGRPVDHLGDGAIADVDEGWEPGCVQGDETPRTHFLFAGRSPGLWFVLFEQGGFVVSRTLVTIREVKDGSFALAGRWWVQEAPVDVASLQRDPSKLETARRSR